MGTSRFTVGVTSGYEYKSEIISFDNKKGVIKDYIVYVSDNPMLSNKSITVY